MRGILAGWDALDPALRWLMRINLIALTTATLLLASAYVLGFRHTSVEVDLGVMAVSIVLMLVTPPLCRRYGAPAAIVGLTLSALLFAVGGTWATPNLSPLTALLTMVPLLVGFAYLGRRWIQVLSVVAVAGSAGVAALAEWRRTEAVRRGVVGERRGDRRVPACRRAGRGVPGAQRLRPPPGPVGRARRVAAPGRRGGRRRPAQPGARPARRRPAAAAGLERDHRAGPQGAEGRAARVGGRPCSTSWPPTTGRSSPSCASWPAASTRRCSPSAVWSPPCSRRHDARRCR